MLPTRHAKTRYCTTSSCCKPNTPIKTPPEIESTFLETMKSHNYILIISVLLFAACNNSEKKYDASGTFEATQTIISAEANGRLLAFTVEEGQTLDLGAYVGYIDSTQLFLRKQQLLAQIQATESQKPDISTQLAALKSQLAVAKKDQKRIQNMAAEDAATQQQLDNANGRVETLESQIEGQRKQLEITTGSISSQTDPLQIQVAQVEDMLDKCRLINPMKGTVLTKYAEANETVNAGKPLYRIANLNDIYLKAYITASQLDTVKLNQKVTVLTDDGNKGYKKYEGTLYWISDKAEFTPKTIQTKEERANKVYAVKIRVQNDGYLKIGMYGEVVFSSE